MNDRDKDALGLLDALIESHESAKGFYDDLDLEWGGRDSIKQNMRALQHVRRILLASTAHAG